MDINVFYRTVSVKEAYRSFKHNKEISFTTFYKNIGKKFKPPHRDTDVCDWCEYGKEIKKEITAYFNQMPNESNLENEFNSTEMLNRFENLIANSDVDRLLFGFLQYLKKNIKI